MAIATLYVDIADEITTVIERIKTTHEPIVALVVPKGAILIQSIVNLKLARKCAQDAEKDLILVTTDKIGRNLATQIGIRVVQTEKEIARAASGDFADDETEEAKVIAGVRIHRYYSEEADSEPDQAPEAPEVIVPKNLKSESAPVKPVEPPIVIQRKAVPDPDPNLEPELESNPDLEQTKSVPAPTQASTKQSKAEPNQKSAAQRTGSKPSPSKRKRILAGLLIGLVVLLILSLASVSYLMIPATKFILTLSSTPWSEKVTFYAQAEKNLTDPTLTNLTAQKLITTQEDSVEFKATGTKKTGDAAKGTATIFNSQFTAPQTLRSGSKITANGLVFSTTAEVTVPGYTAVPGKITPGSATVPVTADGIGPDYNLSVVSGTITSPADTFLIAQITSTTGGTSRDLTIVSASDITTAKDALIAKLTAGLKDKMTTLIGSNEYKFNSDSDLFKLENFATDQAVGAEVAGGRASGRGTLDRLVIDNALIQTAINQKVTNATANGMAHVLETNTLDKVTQPDPNTLVLELTLSGKDTQKLDTSVLPEKLAGQSLESARAYLSKNTPAKAVEIAQNPEWWPFERTPALKSYIKVELRYE